jgi:hypothetical protein
MRKVGLLMAVTAALSFIALASAQAQQVHINGWNHGCFRNGETGYHHYDFCLGPDFVYPHEKVCDKGSCYYR